MPHTKESLIEHLKKEHQASPIQTYLKEIVYGGNDGIVTTFAVVAGFTGAQAASAIPQYSFLTVLLFGLANLSADAASMGLGNFLSLRAEKDVYKSEEDKERHEVRTHPEDEKKETIEILQEKGFSQEDANALTKIYATNENYWVSFMMNYELEMANPSKENPTLTALATFSSFILFGFIPLLPYLLLKDEPGVFLFSCLSTFSALVMLGVLRFRVTTGGLLRSISEIVLVGGTASTIAYLVGTFFRI
ncbi:MAG TPA: VIT1/CCC1 transporter family protein [Patescibacteria group bacterium]|nr:VIT1/CCC1 transporter family protein [Patescibacteria group bacterium]